MGSEIIVIPILFVALPWIIFHYITKWKTMGSITSEDEDLLEELYTMARKLDDRMDTVERLMRTDNPGWKPDRLTSAANEELDTLDAAERMMQERKR